MPHHSVPALPTGDQPPTIICPGEPRGHGDGLRDRMVSGPAVTLLSTQSGDGHQPACPSLAPRAAFGRSCSKWGDRRLYPETGGHCWTLAIRVWLRAWDKTVPASPCLPSSSSTHRKPVEGRAGSVGACRGVLGWNSWACG